MPELVLIVLCVVGASGPADIYLFLQSLFGRSNPKNIAILDN